MTRREKTAPDAAVMEVKRQRRFYREKKYFMAGGAYISKDCGSPPAKAGRGVTWGKFRPSSTLGQIHFFCSHTASRGPSDPAGDQQPTSPHITFGTLILGASPPNLDLDPPRPSTVFSNPRSRTTSTMGEATITQANWRLVEVGRVVLIQNDSPYNGRLAAVVEIIDHKRVCPSHLERPGRRLGRPQWSLEQNG